MKITTISVILSLVSCCFFLGTGTSAKKLDCSKYQQVKQGPIACTLQYEPHCGTDGKTYGNECDLCSKILNGADIGLAFKGECVDCSKYPPPKKGPNAPCPKIYAPLCGTDGETYGNLCLLCAKIRKTGKQIGIRKHGECKEQVPQQQN